MYMDMSNNGNFGAQFGSCWINRVFPEISAPLEILETKKLTMWLFEIPEQSLFFAVKMNCP